MSMYLTGVSRSLTHELIRHRHFSYSQLSQRYVPERDAAFVEPAVIAEDPELHERVPRRDRRRAGRLHRPAGGAGEALRRRPQRHAAPQAGPAGRPRGAAQRHRDAHRRHRQLPRLAALRRHAGQRARRRRDPRAGHRLPARAAAGGRQRVRRLPDQRAGRRHRGRGQPATSPRAEPFRRRRPVPSGPWTRAPIDTQYEDLLRHVLEHGTPKPDRTGTGTRQPVRPAAALRPVRAASRWSRPSGCTSSRSPTSCCGSCAATATSAGCGSTASPSGTSGPRRTASSARSTACSGGPGRRPDGEHDRPDRRRARRRCAPTPTRAG